MSRGPRGSGLAVTTKMAAGRLLPSGFGFWKTWERTTGSAGAGQYWTNLFCMRWVTQICAVGRGKGWGGGVYSVQQRLLLCAVYSNSLQPKDTSHHNPVSKRVLFM